MTYNIRLDVASDGENRWDYRKKELKDFILNNHPDIIGMQEVLPGQLGYLSKKLKGYNHVGVGRTDGKEKGEFNPVFFDESKWNLIDFKTFWLSESPEHPSKSWDAALERIASYVHLENKRTKDDIYVFNTHFDHMGQVARDNSARLLLDLLQEMGLKNESVLVMGDLNAEPAENPIQILKQGLDDAFEYDPTRFRGPEGTWTGFDTSKQPNKRIDYIFYVNLKPIQTYHLDPRKEDGLMLSDHLPVLVVFE